MMKSTAAKQSGSCWLGLLEATVDKKTQTKSAWTPKKPYFTLSDPLTVKGRFVFDLLHTFSPSHSTIPPLPALPYRPPSARNPVSSTERERERERERETDRQTDRQTDRDRDRQKRQRQRHRDREKEKVENFLLQGWHPALGLEG